MQRSYDILLFGTGSLAQSILYALSLSNEALEVAVAGRTPARCEWLVLSANVRSRASGKKVNFHAFYTDYEEAHLPGLIQEINPGMVVQTASHVSPWLAGTATKWASVVNTCGFGVTTLLQVYISYKIGKALNALPSSIPFVNCCYPDVTNGILAQLGLPVACGIGNINILAETVGTKRGISHAGAFLMLAHHNHVAQVIRKQDMQHRYPQVWIGGALQSFDKDFYNSLNLSPGADLNCITGCISVPLFTALLGKNSYRGHAPGPEGLPGGYPVRVDKGELRVEWPAGLTKEQAIAWNKSFEEEEGVLVGKERLQYSPKAQEVLSAYSNTVAAGFAFGDLEVAAHEMIDLFQDLSKA
jgi:hypothetical protein